MGAHCFLQLRAERTARAAKDLPSHPSSSWPSLRTGRRIYGDFSNGRLVSWNAAIRTFAIVQHQEPGHARGKNAADIALVIDAMDLAHGQRLDGFCLISSDSDFTRLAQRLREGGLRVYGFGEQKTPHAFRNACHRFAILGKPGSGADAGLDG